MAFNKRLIIWLIKAYLKKWKKTILIFFLIGLAFFFLIYFFLSSIIAKFPLIQKETIGVVGSYTNDTLPTFILQDVSHGLTKIDSTGKAKPDIAESWDIKDSGKTYVFHIKPDMYFADGTHVTSKEISYHFTDVKEEYPNDSTILFRLKDVYAPFLTTVSKPIFRKGFVGVGGQYEIKDVQFNGDFITSLTLVGIKNPLNVKNYQFFPTQESLRLAFVLGDVSKAIGLTDLAFKNTSLAKFPNATVTRQTDYNELVTIFYNTQDSTLSDKKLRDALSYALPNIVPWGERAESPIVPSSWAYTSAYAQTQDLEHAKLLIQNPGTLTISTLPTYQPVAEELAKAWKAIGVKTKIVVVPGIPDVFQIFLGSFNVPKDPDQYVLWHSDQPDNISNYKNLRIDKLLEDGRKTINQDDRLKSYLDFQKYLMDDQPATFLYFPYEYTVTRK